MPPKLLESQFATLEPPGDDENPLTVSIEPPPDAIIETVVQRLRARI
jgi:gluconate kinase